MTRRTTDSTECRPFLKWAGGKTQLLDELVRRVPPTFNRYFEPFVGGGALFFHLQPERAVLSDVTADLVNAYKVVQTKVEPLIRDLRRHVYEREYFEEIRAADRQPSFSRWSDVRRASRLIYLNKTCFNGLYRLNNKGFFNTPFGRYKCPTIVDRANLRACSTALSTATILAGSFEHIEAKVKKGDFVYFDPPYVPLNATANFTGYSEKKFDLAMQERLFHLCVSLDRRRVKFMLSNSSHPWVVHRYERFRLAFVPAARAINSKGGGRGKVSEVIVTNYKA